MASRVNFTHGWAASWHKKPCEWSLRLSHLKKPIAPKPEVVCAGYTTDTGTLAGLKIKYIVYIFESKAVSVQISEQ